ncbi:MAG: ATP-binding cassette domain-containing protein [Rhodobacteraceae bacterium]|nr:ATP-binding cassette domain-containing protein [Paracoccaceae bacterium]
MAIISKDFRALRLDNVQRDFGAFNALKGITLDIARGEFVALLGPSGCGKSTALNCVAGLLPLTDGTISLDDTRIDQLSPEHRGFGMVFQNYALFPHMTVARNVGFGLAMRGESKANIVERVAEALRLVRLEGQADKLPGQLSGGQQQRVAIARAIVVAPPLVMMDEPLSNLDAKLRLEMRAEIRRIHAHLGSATIYVTHDQDEALSLADRIVVMRQGEVRQVGTPEALYARPATLDVAEFMGFRNLLPGRIDTGTQGAAAVVTVEDTSCTGTPVGPLQPGAVTLAIRPDDLSPRDDGPFAAHVEQVEYRGRAFFGIAATGRGTSLHFHSPVRVKQGEALRLGADPDRILIYGAAP